MGEYLSEFRHLIDDAWYSVRMESSGEMFTVKYKDFTEEEDSVFEISSFTSLPELHGFRNRFRPLSRQLQDNECHSVLPGTPVCASHSFDAQNFRFYDAVIEDVVHVPHGVDENGEDECLCDFILLWSHGPRSKYCDTKKIDSLCLVQSNGVLDPKVEAFVSLVKGKLADSSTAPKLQSLPLKPKTTFAQRVAQGTKFAKRSSPLAICPVEEVKRGCSYTEGEDSYFGVNGNHCTGVREEDGDFGGGSQLFGLLIDNLEKNLAPSAIVEFIHAQTSLFVQAYVFISFPYETYTKGAIVLDCEKNLEKLCKFLDSPDHVVMSRDGRPWVVSGKLSQFDTFMGPNHDLILKYQDQLHHRSLGVKCNDDLKLVCSGSEEYTRAEQRRDMFTEFVEHQHRMHTSLALEERVIRSCPTLGVQSLQLGSEKDSGYCR